MQDVVGPLKIAQEINLVNVNWNTVCETYHLPLLALDVSFCSEFRLNYFKYFWHCHYLSFVPLCHYEVGFVDQNISYI